MKKKNNNPNGNPTPTVPPICHPTPQATPQIMDTLERIAYWNGYFFHPGYDAGGYWFHHPDGTPVWVAGNGTNQQTAHPPPPPPGHPSYTQQQQQQQQPPPYHPGNPPPYSPPPLHRGGGGHLSNQQVQPAHWGRQYGRGSRALRTTRRVLVRIRNRNVPMDITVGCRECQSNADSNRIPRDGYCQGCDRYVYRDPSLASP